MGSMESQPQNPEFRIIPDIFHLCFKLKWSIALRLTEYTSEKLSKPVYYSILRLKFSLKILNSGLFLTTFTHVFKRYKVNSG